MIASGFASGFPGELVEVTDALGSRGPAFVPDRLPPRFDLGSKPIRLALSRADRALAHLAGVAGKIERAALLFRNYLRREAVLSSRIEGTRTTLADLLLFEASGSADAPGDDRVVSNYLSAFDYGRLRCLDIPVGRRLFQEMHAILFDGTDSSEVTPGRVRDCLVVIGRPPLAEARFVPPPPLFVPELLDDLDAFLESNDEPPLLKIAIAHYQFEAIHPFRDGSGRIGRLLVSMALHREKILTEPLLYLSAFFEREKQRYYDALLQVSTDGAWEEWILFFLEGVETQSIDATSRTERLVSLRDEFHNRVTGPRVTQNLHRLIDYLFSAPILSVPTAAETLGVTYPAARNLVARLTDAGILSAMPTQVRGTTFYRSDEILRALSDA